MAERTDRERRAERRAEQQGHADQDREETMEDLVNQYETAESAGEESPVEGRTSGGSGAGVSGARGSARRGSSSRHRSVSRGRHSVLQTTKLEMPVFKNGKKGDPDVHVQAFEHWAKIKDIPEEDWEMFFPSTLKEQAQKWYYKYPPKKLPTYERAKKAFLTRFRDEKTDEELLCDLGRIRQRKNSVRKFVERLKDLTKQLEEEPADMNMRAWFLNGCNSKKLRSAEVLTPTATFDDLVARALKLEKKKKRSSDDDSSDSSDSTSSSSTDSEESEKSRKQKKKSKKTSQDDTKKTIEQLTKQIEKLTAQRSAEPSRGEKWCVKCKMSNHSTEECKLCEFCGSRGHLWDRCPVRLQLMVKEGQEVRMVTNTETSAGAETSTSYGGRGYGRGYGRGGRGGRGPRIFTCFICGKEGHFAAECPDKPKPKEAAPALNMVSPAELCVITRSQAERMALEDKPSEEKETGEKSQSGKEWQAQRSLAGKFSGGFSEKAPEYPDVKVQPTKKLGSQQRKSAEQGQVYRPKNSSGIGVEQKDSRNEQSTESAEKEEEGGKKKVRFAEPPVQDGGTSKSCEKQPIQKKKETGKPVKYERRPVKERNEEFRKAAGKGTSEESQESCQEYSDITEQVDKEQETKVEIEPLREVWARKENKKKGAETKGSTTGSKQNEKKEWRVRESSPVVAQSSSSESSDNSEGAYRGKKESRRWVPKPTTDVSSEASDGVCSEDDKEYIYTQVCRRINQLTLELDKLRTALPACEAFLHKWERKRQAEVMTAGTAPLKDDHIPMIQLDCKVRKHWKTVEEVVIDGGAGVNIMSEQTKKMLGIQEVKEAPFRIRMADQRIVQPLGLVENVPVRAGGLKS